MATPTRPHLPAQILWPATPRGVHQARHSLERRLARWELADLAPVAGLVLTELMTNAYRHATAPGRRTGVSILPVPGGVRIEVHDSVPLAEGAPTLRPAPSDAERGRGLALVDALTAQRWGVTHRDGPGKVVWAVCTGLPA
ncbi:ATP-binding protein [Streptomyces sp. NPDC049040]|uniref:ATP-binding protein n=1 Tax=Streptomyces sp. NPDC049040 TaxID=3365593 RepID=UPI00371321D0